jgi:hypothetical protein
MHDEYGNKVGSMSMGVGRLNNNQVVVRHQLYVP